MEIIIHNLDKKKPVKTPNLSDFDVVASKKFKLIGIALTSDIIFRTDKPLYSFRLKLENITDLKHFDFFTHKALIDRTFLEKYFESNYDSPYGVELVFQLLLKGQDVNATTLITQFPPMKRPENLKTEFEKLVSQVQPGDIIFTADEQSNVSKIIREIDFVPFSHSLTVYDSLGTVQEMTTSGMCRHNITDMNPLKYKIALYRHIDHLPEEDVEKLQNIMDKALDENIKFGWSGLFKAYLFRKYKSFRWLRPKHPWKGTTGFDLLFANRLKLIAYV